MSQKIEYIDKEITFDLKLKVIIKSFSNHNGFKESQIKKAVEEFKENIKEEIEWKIEGNYYQQEFLQTVDFVNYEIKTND